MVNGSWCMWGMVNGTWSQMMGLGCRWSPGERDLVGDGERDLVADS